METKEADLKTIQPFIDTIIEFLIESVPTKDLPQVDAIFVFGHYEPQVAHHAAELWKKGKAPRIIISGKGRDAIPKGFETEADFYASLVESDGVPKEALILEKESTNSLENVLLGMAKCRNAGVNPKSVILCAMPPLLQRSCATFRKQFPDITVYGSAFSMPQEWFTLHRINRLLGELERLDEYAKKGDIVKVEIPNKVLSAAEKIRQHLLQ
ncbi:MAG: YdcF family protein [Patescibacteria group bacterium]